MLIFILDIDFKTTELDEKKHYSYKCEKYCDNAEY